MMAQWAQVDHGNLDKTQPRLQSRRTLVQPIADKKQYLKTISLGAYYDRLQQLAGRWYRDGTECVQSILFKLNNVLVVHVIIDTTVTVLFDRKLPHDREILNIDTIMTMHTIM